jgi:hypothetical protein
LCEKCKFIGRLQLEKYAKTVARKLIEMQLIIERVYHPVGCVMCRCHGTALNNLATRISPSKQRVANLAGSAVIDV